MFYEQSYNTFPTWLNFITKLNFNQLNIQKTIDKDNFEKKHKKITWKNIATIHSVLKKKNNKAKFLISSILKKKSTEAILEKKITKQTPKKRKKIILETL